MAQLDGERRRLLKVARFEAKAYRAAKREAEAETRVEAAEDAPARAREWLGEVEGASASPTPSGGIPTR